MPDIRPILGAVVFFTILGLVAFTVYYLAVIKPEADRLESTRSSALAEVRSLYANLSTEQAIIASRDYSSKISRAKTVSEINNLLADARSVAVREKKRMELLKEVEDASTGTFHSAADVPVLNQHASSLKEQIKARGTLEELMRIESTIDDEMTSAWREFFLSMLQGVEGSKRVVLVTGNSWLYMTAENAKNYIQTKSWKELKGMDLEMSSTVEVTIQDTFARTPKIRPGTLVNIYVYDTSKKEISLLVGGARVLSAIYPQEVLSSISWTSPDGTATYSVDIWETIKAQVAGSPAATGVWVDNYANKVIDKGLNAGLGMYQLSVLYTVEVPEGAARLICKYELHETDKDIILIPVLP
jgi:hypothetical protein